jgi:putative ABC transport system permease protein
MIKNRFKIALRYLWKHKSFSVIRGIAIGLPACFFIAFFVHFELSYENFHAKADRICRPPTDVKTPSEIKVSTPH